MENARHNTYPIIYGVETRQIHQRPVDGIIVTGYSCLLREAIRALEKQIQNSIHNRCISVKIEMTVIAIVSETTREEAVLFEAADQAEELNTDIHVVYLIGIGWIARIEWWIADLLNLGGGLETVGEISKQKAETVADPILDEYTPVGLVGKPVQEIVEYGKQVDADCIVLDRKSKMAVGITSMFRDPVENLRVHGFQVVTVY